MTEENMQKESYRTLSVAQWQQLIEEGLDIPVHIPLHGSSMSPLIRRMRDVVCIRAFHRDPLPGDIVLFHSYGERYVVHRIWKIRDGKVLTFGDNCARPDGWCEPEQILGLVTHVQRGKWNLSMDHALNRKLGLIWLYLQPVRSFTLRVLRKIRRIFGRSRS